MFKIAICDDNKYDINEIMEFLKDLESMYGIQYETSLYDNGYELIRDIEQGKRFHLLVLDMLMDQISGIETAKRIRQYDLSMYILIVTSTVEFALEGYKINAWRYIMKPLDRDKFVKMVAFIHGQTVKQQSRFFTFENDRGLITILLDDILYFESSLHTITLKTVNLSYSFRSTLNEIEDKLKNRGFMRIHRSYIVNLKYVQKYSSKSVTLADGESLDLSRNKISELHDKLLDYISQEIEESIGYE